jgi:signal transduction histidine kinase
MTPEEQAHIFEPFFMANSSQVPSVSGGTGVGLAIVAQLVELLEGKIELTSRLGDGSTFTLIFPLNPKLEMAAEEENTTEEA